MTRKIRHLLLPAIAAAMLSGCVTYGYRGGQGDYYYGQPTTEYVDPYGYGGYGYGYPGYGYGYPGYYSAPYWSGGFGYYGHYYPYRPRPPHNNGGHGGGNGNHGGNNGNGNGQPPPQNRPDRPRPPWRDLNGIGRPNQGEPPSRPEQPQSFRPMPVQPAARPSMQPAPAQVRMPPQRAERVEGGVAPRRAVNPKRDGRRIPAP